MLPRITTNSPLRNIYRKPARLTFAVAAATVAAAAITVGLAPAGPGQASAASQAGITADGSMGHAFGASAAHFTAGRTGRPAGQALPGRAHAGAGQPGAANFAYALAPPRSRVVHRAAGRKAVRRRRWHPVFGLDSMSGVGSSALTHTGVHFVARYIVPGNPKTLTRGELATLQRHGTRVVAIWELGAMDMLGGYQAGKWAAQQAQQGLNGLGIPHAAVYFCADFDASPWQQGAINNYLRGAASVVGLHRTGLYGGYWVIKRAFDAHVIQYGWQTYAWSGGLWDPRAALRQYSVNQYRAGVPVDLNLAVHPQYGAVYPGR